MTEKTETNVGEIIRAARAEKRLSLRKVETLSKDLAERDPTVYEAITKSTMWEIEEYGQTFFAHRNTSPGKVRALIHLLWDGDTAKFQQDTGVEVLPVAKGAAPLPTGIPHYLELESTGGRASWTRIHTPEYYLRADFVIESRTSRMEPVITEGQMLYCQKKVPRVGEVCVIERENMGLIIAWCIGANTFEFGKPLEGDPEVLSMGSKDSFLGVVEYTKPQRRQAYR
ncbi:hypothetical protein [Deinococcus cellulosilyticus]|uniref:Uncharacterized protein n=1 Tax=Deinococcus cellulosilyticus (strain DSM 18568 / NBRC 106333 / KACC 11606 / 5516J-15) TaxID=1223518 RepID=A0A511N7B3_DEIC1|nr:hypothetical protein [Deinococcus cellulosilyticus]GEM48732.1 hypothetical protein DC3_43670 [Deinococcus cellulosilyticus NBRC 106333 = KACC 11606]